MKEKKFFTASNGDLVKTSDYEVLRKNYSKTYRTITNGKELCSTIRAGNYAWPGGYPMYICGDGATIHVECAKEHLLTIINELRNAIIGPLYCEINYEDNDMICDICNKKIKCAYKDDKDVKNDE